MLFFLWKNSCISRLIWPDWESTAWADMTRFGSIGLMTRIIDFSIGGGLQARGWQQASSCRAAIEYDIAPAPCVDCHSAVTLD